MGTPHFTLEFKEESVRQITERGYSVADVFHLAMLLAGAQSVKDLSLNYLKEI